ncbi:uncharacterized protein N7458_004306 [Penicillium daleae]|uniref:Major facilitator superfamily (MFS) profile domain-containing protein n=1 Tax=Penicillium daleae TaxID=63821 RepID=A0AAD6CA89_9EURO|nr:uncharacterized protein N7458_004306 [Penicillium daleae]KAJ5456042.1 hypothetical protein N7458_004306 [Penicillium daleae]
MRVIHEPASTQHSLPQIEIEKDRYPEGGLKAWSVVLGAWCAMIPSMGLLNSLGTLQAWTSTHQLNDYSESSIGWIFGAYTFFLFVGGAQFGRHMFNWDRTFVSILEFQPRCVSDASSYSLVIMICSTYTMHIVLGGISASTLFTPPVAAVGHWFHDKRGWATGIACTAGGIGGSVFPLIILFAAPRIGFAWAIRIIALLCALFCSIACLTVRTRLPPKKAATFLDFNALMDVKYASASLGVFLVEFAVFVPITYITSYALSVGFGDQMSYALLIFLNVGAIFGRFLPGLVADRFGRFNVMTVNCLMCSLLTLILWLSGDLVNADSLGILISYAVLFGFFSGAAISIAPVCISQVCEIQDYGKRVGTTWTLVSLGTLIAIPVAGAIQQHNNGAYYGLIIFGGALYLSSAVAFAVSRGICKGWAWRTVF